MTAYVPIREDFGFKDFDATNNLLMASAAMPLGGFTVQQDYEDVILDYRKTNTVFWQMILPGNKKNARTATIQKMARDKRARVGFTNRMDLSATVHNRKEDLNLNLNDPGQPLRALTSSIEFPHFPRSVAKAQGLPYSDEIAENTDSMLKEGYRFLEMALFTAANTPETPHSFNGLQAQQTETGHVFTVDTLGDTPESIIDTINEVCTRIATDRNVRRRVSHLMVTGAAYTAISREVRANSIKVNMMEIVPGVRVPAILTGDGEKPIFMTPYLDDLADPAGDNTHDIVRIFPIDLECVEWWGLIPDGGAETIEPQIFDMSASMYSAATPLVLQRMMLMYGTPYLNNEGLWRIDIKVPRGRAWSLAQEMDLQLEPATQR